jgi:hypothetical protein
MTTANTPRRLAFTGKQQVHIESFEPKPLEKGHVRVRTEVSLMSTGTENIVFNRLFDPGTIGTTGSNIPSIPVIAASAHRGGRRGRRPILKIGERVASRVGHHRSHSVRRCGRLLIPSRTAFPPSRRSGMASQKSPSWARAAGYQLGRQRLIIGAGPIGQMSLRWAHAAGCTRIIVVDTAGNRMPLAQAGGATATIKSNPSTEAREAVLAGRRQASPRRHRLDRQCGGLRRRAWDLPPSSARSSSSVTPAAPGRR